MSSGINWLRDPLNFRGLSTPQEQRTALGIQGYLPAAVRTFEEQDDFIMIQLRKKSSALEKYSFLQQVQNTDERLYYACLCKHTKECMPLVYTPTVGAACLAWSELYTGAPRGLYLSLEHAGSIGAILNSWPQREHVKVIVFTDGERILGLGDLGSNGMGISIGKLALYTACAGVDPKGCLPVCLDVGTNNQNLLDDPMYIGLRRSRERGQAYDALVEEFVTCAQAAFGPQVLLQFEDFGNANAFRLLERYQPRACTFNDDIQGTAAVVLAGIAASGRLSGRSLADETFLFLGAGEAGIGIADLIALAIARESSSSSSSSSSSAPSALDLKRARSKIWLVDIGGLLCDTRTDLAPQQLPYAHPAPTQFQQQQQQQQGGGGGSVLLDAVACFKPTCLIGVSAVASAFSEAVVKLLCANTPNKPVIMALSNPTFKAECTASQAYEWSNGECVFASGSPFDPVTLPDGRSFTPGQGNNSYVFPAVGLAAISVQAKRLTDDDMYVAAKALAECVDEGSLASGCVYPPLSDIRRVTCSVAASVAANVISRGDSAAFAPSPSEKPSSGGSTEQKGGGLVGAAAPPDLRAFCEAQMYDPWGEEGGSGQASASASPSSSNGRNGSADKEANGDGNNAPKRTKR